MLSKSLFLIVMTLFLAACGGLGGEPEIVATLPPPQVSAPPSPPDVARGEAIYAENCVQCHAADGSGNAPLVQQGQISKPRSFLDPATARNQTPQDMYDIITNGRIQNLMPPWRDALTEQQRWDVALYVYTLHYAQEQLTSGSDLFIACAECHDGSNPQAADLLDYAKMVSLSDETIYQTVKNGNDNGMHPFNQSFNEEELRAVTAYVRSLTIENEDFSQQPQTTAEPAVAPTATLEATMINVMGTVQNGTEGVDVPADLTVELLVFDLNLTPQTALTQETTLAEDNSFIFEDVVIRNDQVYLTSVSYEGRNFASGFVKGDTSLTELELPITVYELTTEPSVIEIAAMVSQINVVGDTIEVHFVTRFSNTSDRVFVGTETLPDGRASVLKMPLPPGAIVIAYDEQEKYYAPEGESYVIDTRPLTPGEDRFNQLVYILQYGGGAIVEYPTEYRVDGPVRVLLQPDTVTLESDQLPSRGVETLGGVPYQGYGVTEGLQLAAGDVIRYQLSGQALEAATGQQVVTGDNLLPMLLGLAGMALLVTAGVIYLTTRNRPVTTVNQERMINTLVREIAELDEQHEAGQINHDVYQRRRAELKAQLAALMDKKE